MFERAERGADADQLAIQLQFKIRKSAPQSRINIVSQESSPDIVQEVLSLGTCGYVVKSKAEHDFVATVDEVLEGSQFLRVHWQKQFTDAMHTASSYDAASDGPQWPMCPIIL